MDDLFEKLKSESPTNKSSPKGQKTITKNGKETPEHKENENCTSMPPPNTAVVVKTPNRSSGISPPKKTSEKQLKKNLKVLVERKKMNDNIKDSPVGQKNQSLNENNESALKTKINDEQKMPESPTKTVNKTIKPTKEKSPLKVTPTKAEQKLFDATILKKVDGLKPSLKTKRFLVKIKRSNLIQLKKDFDSKSEVKIKKTSPTKTVTKPKGLAVTSPEVTPKRKRQDAIFIKLPKSPLVRSSNRSSEIIQADSPKKPKIVESKTTIEKTKEKPKEKSPKALKLNKSLTKPTKFTRTQLFKTFGKRFFRSYIKMERCKHPLALTFESNERARKQQAKRNKSKNLTVSFSEQVEVFGGVDSQSEPSDNENTDVPCTSAQAALNNKLIATPPVTPARLKKVENGKVVDDIELDASLFMAPQNANASTPFPQSPLRKKREKKSFSPLKGDEPSPRKEELKLANEKLPPSGLRRLNLEDDDEEDDDECEYIVPIEIPQRHAPQNNTVTPEPTENMDVAAGSLPEIRIENIVATKPADVTEVATVSDDVALLVEGSKSPEDRESPNSFVSALGERESALENELGPGLRLEAEEKQSTEFNFNNLLTEELSGNISTVIEEAKIVDKEVKVVDDKGVKELITTDIIENIATAIESEKPQSSSPIIDALDVLIKDVELNGVKEKNIVDMTSDDNATDAVENMLEKDDTIAEKLADMFEDENAPFRLFVDDSSQNITTQASDISIVEKIVNETINELGNDAVVLADVNGV